MDEVDASEVSLPADTEDGTREATIVAAPIKSTMNLGKNNPYDFRTDFLDKWIEDADGQAHDDLTPRRNGQRIGKHLRRSSSAQSYFEAHPPRHHHNASTSPSSKRLSTSSTPNKRKVCEDGVGSKGSSYESEVEVEAIVTPRKRSRRSV